MSAGRILVAVATYNEIENLPRLVEEIHIHLPPADILVVDDDSPDGTGRWCVEHAATDSKFACLHRKGERGLGSATIAALRYALEQGYDFVLTMDADFSHPTKYLSDLVAAAESADVVIGSRYVAGGAIEGWPLVRRFASRTVNAASRWLAGLKPHDCSGAFRCYRVEALGRMELDAVQEAGFAYLEEILWHLQKAGARVVEVPIVFHERRQGQSKAGLGEAIAKLRTICRLASLRWR